MKRFFMLLVAATFSAAMMQADVTLPGWMTSNMEMPVKGWGMVNNYEQEVANATYPMVRLFQVERVVARTPQTQVPLGYTKGWVQCTPESCRHSAAYC